MLGILGGGALGFLLLLGFGLLVRALGLALPRSAVFSMGTIAVYLGLSVGAWYFAARRRGHSLRALGMRGVELRTALLMLPVALGLMVVNLGLIALTSALFGRIENPQEVALRPLTQTPTDLLWLFAVVAIAAPIAEEIIFRGLLYPYLRGHIGVALAVLITAALFAAAHAIGQILLPLFVTGVVLALLAERYQSIVPSIIVHAVNNGVQIGLFYAAARAVGAPS